MPKPASPKSKPVKLVTFTLDEVKPLTRAEVAAIRRHGYHPDPEMPVMTDEQWQRALKRRGRPPRGELRSPTATRAVRLPETLWRILRQRAKAQHLTVNAALHAAALEWASTH